MPTQLPSGLTPPVSCQSGAPRSGLGFSARSRRLILISRLGSYRGFRLGILLSGVVGLSGCKELTGSPGLPAGTPNPDVYANAAGAVGMRNAAVWQLEKTLIEYVTDAGLVTDELTNPATGASAGLLLSQNGVRDALDERILPETGNVPAGGRDVYAGLQQVRGMTSQALGALAAYDTAKVDTATAKVLRGELYAFEGYTEILLADLFCSGVPLSTVDFGRDYTFAHSFTKEQVYRDAIFKLDTALTLAKASDSVRYLALVLKGRAYLALGQYDSAATMVAPVPDSFQYQLVLGWNAQAVFPTQNGVNELNNEATVADREGGMGLPYLSSGDPRTAGSVAAVSTVTGNLLYFPNKYSAALSGNGYAPFTVASGIEARLIEAEAQLQPASAPSGPWLATLNRLRQTAPIPGTQAPAPDLLPQLTDPGAGLQPQVAATARIDTLFTERAAWLFLDGHRQGDLRRLLRQYGGLPPQGQGYTAFKDQSQVYPTGPYLAPGLGTYGSDVTVPISNESANPYYHGCLDRQP